VSRVVDPILQELGLVARRIRFARREATRVEATFDGLVREARSRGIPYRSIARTLLRAWSLPTPEAELARFGDALRKRLERTPRPLDALTPASQRRPRASSWPFEKEVLMPERVVRRVTQTVTEEFTDAPACVPCSAPLAGEAANDTPAANDGPAPETAARRAPANRFAHLIGRTFDFSDDGDHVEGASCPRPLSGTEHGAAPSCPEPSDEDGE
jgi:hypothetical protein